MEGGTTMKCNKNKIFCVIFAVFLLIMSVGNLVIPKDEFSESERRPLAAFPEFSGATVLNGKFMSKMEEYAVDNYPFRDFFRRIKALSNRYLFGQQDNNGIYLSGDYAATMEYPLHEDSIDYAAEKFRYLYETYFAQSEGNVYLSVIPDKSYFMAEKEGKLRLDYEKMITQLRDSMEYATYIDIFGDLQLEDYYKTDTHWRQEKILDVAEKLANAMGTQLTGSYTENTLDRDFYGVYYGQSALPLQPEKIHYLTSDILDQCKVYDLQNEKESTVYDMEKAYGKDAYEMFLSGSISLMTIENPNASNDRELVVFRDSFGSSITPLLVSGYSKITLVDIRYLPSAYLSRFVEFENQDVLFLYSTSVLNNSDTLK